MNPSRARGRRGFTMVEVVVVALIVVLLASVALPYLAHLSENGRFSEARQFVIQINKAQESYLLHKGYYATSTLAPLPVDFKPPCSNAGDSCGMKNYRISSVEGGTCFTGTPRWALSLRRCTPADGCVGVPARYQADSFVAGLGPAGAPSAGSGYTIYYDSCLGALSFPGCLTCAEDLCPDCLAGSAKPGAGPPLSNRLVPPLLP